MISEDAPNFDDEPAALSFDSTYVRSGLSEDGSPLLMTREQLNKRLKGVRLPQSATKESLAISHPELRAHMTDLTSVFDGPCLLELFGRDVPNLVDPQLRDWPVWLIKLDDSWAPRVPAILEHADVFSYTGQDWKNPWNVAQWLAVRANFSHETDLYAPHLRINSYHVSEAALYTEGGVIVIIECAGLVSWMGLATDYLLDEMSAGGVCSSSDPLFDHSVASLKAQMRNAALGAPSERNGALTLPVLYVPTEGDSRREELQREEASGVARGREPKVSVAWAQAALGLLPTIVDYIPPEITNGDHLWVRMTVDHDFFKLVRAAGQAPHTTVTPCLLRGVDPAVRVSVQHHHYVVDAYFRAQNLRLQPALDALVRHGRCQIAIECERSGELHAWEVSWPSNCGPVAASALPIPVGTQAILAMEMPYDPEQRQRAQELADSLGSDVSLFSALGKDALTWQLGQLKQRGQGPRGGVVSLIPRFELAT